MVSFKWTKTDTDVTITGVTAAAVVEVAPKIMPYLKGSSLYEVVAGGASLAVGVYLDGAAGDILMGAGLGLVIDAIATMAGV